MKKYLAIYVTSASSSNIERGVMYCENFSIINAKTEEDARLKLAEFLKDAEKPLEMEQDGKPATVYQKVNYIIDVFAILDKIDKKTDVIEFYWRHFRNIEAYENFEPMLKGEL
jgi:hypothetical protein